MIPSLLLIKSNKNRLVTLTLKKNLLIGDSEDSDIIINHPHFAKHTQNLGPNSADTKNHNMKKSIANFIIPVYVFDLDVLNVKLIPLRVLFCILFFACIVSIAKIVLLPDNSTPSTTQDWTPIPVPANGVYGFCNQDRRHAKGVRFIFDAKESQNYRILFFLGSKSDDAIIKLFLNGYIVTRSMRLPTGWGDEVFLPLPSSYIKTGNNIIEIIPQSLTTNLIPWGISEVRIVPTSQSEPFNYKNGAPEFESIISTLRKQNLSAQELAYCYKIVSTWVESPVSGSTTPDGVGILEEIEKRMKRKLHQVAFDVRSGRIFGDQSNVRKLLDETSRWIPEDWEEGWELFNELCY